MPDLADSSWGLNVTNYLVALATGSLQKAGGAFTLTSEVDFGGTYGLKAFYFKTKTATPATTGVVRLAVADKIAFRNNANSADLSVGVSASDRFQIGAVNLALVTDKLSVFAATTSAELAGVLSDETGTGSAVFSTGPTITNPNFTAATVYSNISTPTTPSAGTGKLYFKADLPTYLNSAGVERVVANTTDSLTNPMTTLGDLPYGGVAGAATRRPGNTTTTRKWFRSTGVAGVATAPDWDVIGTGDLSGLNPTQNTAFTLTFTSPEDVYIGTPASAINQDLPTTSVLAGQRFRIIVAAATSTNTVTIRSSSTATVETIGGAGVVHVQALIDTPTTAAHWKVLSVYEEATHATTFGGNGAGSGASSSVNVLFRRVNKQVTMSIPNTGTYGLPAATTTFIGFNTVMPARFRPATGSFQISLITNNGSLLAAYGYSEVTTSGDVRAYRDVANTAYTNAAFAGSLGSTWSWAV